jgi:hypothetical protein
VPVIEDAGTEARKLIEIACYIRGFFGLFVAAELPLNADASVAVPGSDVRLGGKEVRVKHGPESVQNHYQTLSPKKPRTRYRTRTD